jgi:L,D-peptidoglycan transpeptidase YkuD (ErfK/YbiS/YcfS/YnhG family)
MRNALTACAVCLVALAGPAFAAARVGPAHSAANAGPAIPSDAAQLIVVSSATPAPADFLATLSAYERTSGRWHRVLGPWPAETGYGHLRRVRHEGDGSTPIGVFGIGTTMYGNRPEPAGLHYTYRQLVCGDWWDEDPFSPLYNQFVALRCGSTPPFASWSEALWTETLAYPYFAVVNFNTDPIRRGPGAPGSGIFVHSWVDGPTAGCVALHTRELLRLLRWLRPAEHPVIDIGVGVTPRS